MGKLRCTADVDLKTEQHDTLSITGFHCADCRCCKDEDLTELITNLCELGVRERYTDKRLSIVFSRFRPESILISLVRELWCCVQEPDSSAGLIHHQNSWEHEQLDSRSSEAAPTYRTYPPFSQTEGQGANKTKSNLVSSQRQTVSKLREVVQMWSRQVWSELKGLRNKDGFLVLTLSSLVRREGMYLSNLETGENCVTSSR